jgi:hypothetical protein
VSWGMPPSKRGPERLANRPIDWVWSRAGTLPIAGVDKCRAESPAVDCRLGVPVWWAVPHKADIFKTAIEGV